MPQNPLLSGASADALMIERTGDVLTFTLNNLERGNQFIGSMFDAMWLELDRKSTRLNSSHEFVSRMPSSA